MNTMFLKHLNSGIVLLLLLFSSFINPLVRRWSSNDGGVFFLLCLLSKRKKSRATISDSSVSIWIRAKESSHLSPSKNQQSPNGAAATQRRTWNAPWHQKVVAYFCCQKMSHSNNRDVRLQCVPGTKDLLMDAGDSHGDNVSVASITSQ